MRTAQDGTFPLARLHRTRRLAWPALAFCLCAITLAGCLPAPKIQVSEVTQDEEEGGIAVSAGLRAVDDEGKSLDFAAEDLEVTAEVFDAEGNLLETPAVEVIWPEESGEKVAQAARKLDVVLVADNSGSEAEHLELIQAACQGFVRILIPPSEPDRNRVGTVRVSTCATVVCDLTPDTDTLDAAIDDMFITNGWTALYDGVRLASETLQAGVGTKTPVEDKTWRAIVLITDARENNSDGSQEPGIVCDDVDTTFEDLLTQEVEGVPVPVFAIGIGYNVDEAKLRELANATGGFYRSIADFDELGDALSDDGDLIRGLLPFKFIVGHSNGHHARISVFISTLKGKIIKGIFTVYLAGGT